MTYSLVIHDKPQYAYTVIDELKERRTVNFSIGYSGYMDNVHTESGELMISDWLGEDKPLFDNIIYRYNHQYFNGVVKIAKFKRKESLVEYLTGLILIEELKK